MWDSLSAIRYAMIKRLMDTLYASVGTALHITKNRGFLMPITTAMAASYYSLVGPGSKSAEIVSSRVDSSHLIQNAWGVVSSPTIKTISLRVSRLLKGAAIAERISICDVTCFILSKDPCPGKSLRLLNSTIRGKVIFGFHITNVSILNINEKIMYKSYLFYQHSLLQSRDTGGKRKDKLVLIWIQFWS